MSGWVLSCWLEVPGPATGKCVAYYLEVESNHFTRLKLLAYMAYIQDNRVCNGFRGCPN